ncbi:MAG: winged helix-turn-helix transcriptional regulator [Frankiaceae bacterium]|nr:winged helix-turn-helix transcriptional regulator [Frankiaceae bacterium]MBV9869933.1 winged helix-turn-helix transcriptional regulator [Frankiaceae bacterium]
MALSTPAIATAKASLFRALAHPVRIRILEILVDGEQSVGSLADALDIELPPLSQQLAVLRRAHVLVTRREGSMVFYRVADPRMSQLLVTAKQLLATDLVESREILDSLEAYLVDANQKR